MKVFNLPDLGEGLIEAEVVEWHVAEGDTVAADQPLLSVETAKAIVEIPAPFSGRVARLRVAPGEIAAVGAVLVEFDGAAETRADTGTVVGEVTVGEEQVSEAPAPVSKAATGVKAVPAVRALARQLGVDLSIVKPSGGDGVVTRADVERAARRLAEIGEPEPLRGPRRAMAQNMATANAEVVPATLMEDGDVHRWAPGQDVTLRLVRAIVAGCRAEPALNAWYDGDAQARWLLQKIDVAVAVDTEDGLFVPVLRDVAARAEEDLRAGFERLKNDIRARAVPPEEMRGYSITLSNFGTIAGRYAAPVVLPPTVAILGAGRIRDSVVAIDGAPAVHRVIPLSLTFDHRAVTGGEAGRFLRALIDDLEQPA